MVMGHDSKGARDAMVSAKVKSLIEIANAKARVEESLANTEVLRLRARAAIEKARRELYEELATIEAREKTIDRLLMLPPILIVLALAVGIVSQLWGAP